MIRAAMAVAPATATGVDLVFGEARFPRLVALVLDTVFISVISSVATAVYGVQIVTWGSPIPNASGIATWGTQTVIPLFWSVAIWLVYYAVFEAMFSATPGKALTGVVVVRVDGRPISLSAILLRNALRLLDALPLMYLIGGVAVLATAHSQRLGDLAAQTTVVLRRRVGQPSMTRSSGRSARIALVAAVLALVVFTTLFDYFGRPALVIQGEFNQHQLVGRPDIVAYSLGSPSRTLETITYPISITTTTAGQKCSGTVTLMWAGLFGWQTSGSRIDCPPSS
jgi:uncharacterized RDD family membrane protein YckC